MLMSEAVCAACGRSIDAAARLCPFCGANPVTGVKIDTQEVLRQVFHARAITPAQSVVDFARHRQGIVIAATIVVAFLVLAGLHQIVTMRNATAVTSGPAVPLTEITDLRDQPKGTEPLPMPDLELQYDGRSSAMRTFIVEPGAVSPAAAVAPLGPAPPASGSPLPPTATQGTALPAGPGTASKRAAGSSPRSP